MNVIQFTEEQARRMEQALRPLAYEDPFQDEEGKEPELYRYYQCRGCSLAQGSTALPPGEPQTEDLLRLPHDPGCAWTLLARKLADLAPVHVPPCPAPVGAFDRSRRSPED